MKKPEVTVSILRFTANAALLIIRKVHVAASRSRHLVIAISCRGAVKSFVDLKRLPVSAHLFVFNATNGMHTQTGKIFLFSLYILDCLPFCLLRMHAVRESVCLPSLTLQMYPGQTGYPVC